MEDTFSYSCCSKLDTAEEIGIRNGACSSLHLFFILMHVAVLQNEIILIFQVAGKFRYGAAL